MNKVQVNNTEPFTVGGSIMIGNVKLMVVSIGDDYLEVSQSLDEIISEGLVRIAEAVEAVIAKHEGEIKKIDDHAKAEKESALISIASKGNCHDYNHSMRMQALMGNDHQRKIDMIMMAESRARGVAGLGFGNPAGLQGIGASQLSRGGW